MITANMLKIKEGDRKLTAVLAVVLVMFLLAWNDKMDGLQGEHTSKVMIVSILAFCGANAVEHYTKRPKV